MNYLSRINDWLWSPSVWLPPGKTWDDMKSTDKLTMPNFDDIKTCALFLPIIFILLRYFVIEPFFLRPIGLKLGIKESNCKKVPPHKFLESIHAARHTKPIDHNVISSTAHHLGWSERQVERWLRQRRASERVPQMFKFYDCSWQILYYLFYCCFGVYILYDKPWVWDMRECWRNYPFHDYDPDMWWYYMIPLGYYMSSTLTFLYQHKRKDSFQMLCHHLITLLLIIISWAVNLIKIGSLILVVHECADIPLLVAKICGYVGRQDLMDGSFFVFLLLWIVTRLCIFPFWIIRRSIFESYLFVDEIYPIYYLLNGLLLVLQFFHILWTIMIVRIIIKKFQPGGNKVRDVRSESEEISESDLFDPVDVQMNGDAFNKSHEKQS